METRTFVILGVEGSGKTTLAKHLNNPETEFKEGADSPQVSEEVSEEVVRSVPVANEKEKEKEKEKIVIAETLGNWKESLGETQPAGIICVLDYTKDIKAQEKYFRAVRKKFPEGTRVILATTHRLDLDAGVDKPTIIDAHVNALATELGIDKYDQIDTHPSVTHSIQKLRERVTITPEMRELERYVRDEVLKLLSDEDLRLGKLEDVAEDEDESYEDDLIARRAALDRAETGIKKVMQQIKQGNPSIHDKKAIVTALLKPIDDNIGGFDKRPIILEKDDWRRKETHLSAFKIGFLGLLKKAIRGILNFGLFLTLGVGPALKTEHTEKGKGLPFFSIKGKTYAKGKEARAKVKKIAHSKK